MFPSLFGRKQRLEAAGPNQVAELLKSGELDSKDPHLAKVYNEALHYEGGKVLVSFEGSRATAVGFQVPDHPGRLDNLRLYLRGYKITGADGILTATLGG